MHLFYIFFTSRTICKKNITPKHAQKTIKQIAVYKIIVKILHEIKTVFFLIQTKKSPCHYFPPNPLIRFPNPPIPPAAPV